MIQNINIVTPNTTNTFFIKADAQPSYDYTQCPITEAEGIAVLRYIPVGAEVVQGEVYLDGNPLTKLKPATVSFTAVGITHINLYLKKHADATWLQYGKSLSTALGTAEFTLLPTDFAVGDIIDIKLKDADSDVEVIAENLEIMPTP